jgi:crotonobetainyl-CoA:carnitine CoA-transferase CaiB-like acyl-CoA transferase
MKTAAPGPMAGPLHGIKVLELSIWGVGSLSGVALADLGADVSSSSRRPATPAGSCPTCCACP